MPYTWMNAVGALVGGAASGGVPIEELRAGLRGMANEDGFWAILEAALPHAAPILERAIEGARRPRSVEECDHIWDGSDATAQRCLRCGVRQ